MSWLRRCRSAHAVKDVTARFAQGFRSSVRRSRSPTPSASRCRDWLLTIETSADERGQRWLDVRNFSDGRDVQSP